MSKDFLKQLRLKNELKLIDNFYHEDLENPTV